MKLRELARGALIGALYAALTPVIPFSSGLMQLRVSEALCVLPWFCPAAAPGLLLGCLLGNLLSGAVPLDIIFGSLATFAAALLTRRFKKWGASKWLAPLPAVLINAAVVGALLCWAYEVGVPYYQCALYVAAGQSLACYGLGMPLMLVLERHEQTLFG